MESSVIEIDSSLITKNALWLYKDLSKYLFLLIWPSSFPFNCITQLSIWIRDHSMSNREPSYEIEELFNAIREL